MPEVGRAQSRHQRLVRHNGRRRVLDNYTAAENAIDWSSREPSSRTARQERVLRLLAASHTGILPRSYDYAAYYPEVVGILSVLASPYWQRMAGSGNPDDAVRFYHQVAANGLTNGRPQENNPLRNWIARLRAERVLGSS
jgi:hypothetical protein